MTHTTHKSLAVLALLALAGCNYPGPHAYYDRGDPENLLDASSEVVNMGLSSKASLGQLSDAITQDPPARAELHCSPKEALCDKAHDVLSKHGITSTWAQGGSKGVTLVYERVVARDCENRYIDDTNIPSTLPPPTMGCSLMANTVQMVSDKREFVNPGLLDFTDGSKAVQDYEGYERPSPPPHGPALTRIYPGATSLDWK